MQATSSFRQLASQEDLKTLRVETPNKLICLLMTAEWDQPSQLLKGMMQEMAKNVSSIAFCWVDCEQAEDLQDAFSIESVPSLVLLHPNKKEHEKLDSLTPETLNETIKQKADYYVKLMEQEKLHALRDIENLVKSAPFVIFIEGSTDAPKSPESAKLA